MPICEIDPWRMQYFAHVACPADVLIPTEDADSWTWYPKHRWVYDKVAVALSQGLEAAPHGVAPKSFPVFSKPITNLKGMGVGSRVLRSAEEYAKHYAPGHMWMTLLDGRHVSSDVAVLDGAAKWWRHATGHPGPGSTFDHWVLHSEHEPEIEARSGAWIAQHLAGYTGMVNLETIGGRIIEVHLRFADQWPDLYGKGWVEALVRLYQHGRWDYPDTDRHDGYSVVLFGPHGPRYRHPPQALLDEVRVMPSVSSVQITFHEGTPADRHAMPPGGFRLAIVNCWDLDAGRAAREKLATELLKT
ncbi:MAG: hypothetical protein E6G97_19515 [Alphaproteobacteria bacterium]|nr:MAG: hypothetical protein E6G97_19515 [Alphaproteobacteria bacterium]